MNPEQLGRQSWTQYISGADPGKILTGFWRIGKDIFARIEKCFYPF